MPKITINEIENLSLGQLSAIENVVLAPLFVEAYPKNDDKDITVKKYTAYRDFDKDLATIGDSEEFSPADKSYYFIKELLGMGLHVVVKYITYDSDSEESSEEPDFGHLLNVAIRDEKFYEEFADKNLYNVKFITTGAYANWCVEDACFTELAKIAHERGDAVALIELDSEIDLRNSDLITNLLDPHSSDYINPSQMYENAACFYPWGTYVMNYSNNIKLELPASFGYLMAYAYSTQVNEDWLAASGVSRGYIPNLASLNFLVGDSFMHILQGDEYADPTIETYLPIRINPIMFKGTYGNRVWGNRVFAWSNEGMDATTDANVSYKEYLNVRMLLCDIKKQIYAAATRVTFEPNDDTTWIAFKGLVNNLLDRMQNSRGIDWYSWQREYTEKKATIKATLLVKPIEAVEYFEINIQLTDQDTEVVEPTV